MTEYGGLRGNVHDKERRRYKKRGTFTKVRSTESSNLRYTLRNVRHSGDVGWKRYISSGPRRRDTSDPIKRLLSMSTL